MALHLEAAALHRQDHFGAQVLVVVGWRNRKIPFFVTRTISEVPLRPAGIPPALLGVDEVVAFVLILVEADIVEDKKLRFRAEMSRVGNPGGGQIDLRLLGDITRVAIITLLGHGIDHIADHHQRRHFGEWIH